MPEFSSVVFTCTFSPFPQIDIIGAMMIVWRVRGKIIRSVLCSIVCNNCAMCSAHTWTNLSRLLVRFSFSVVILCVAVICVRLFHVIVYLCMCAFVVLDLVFFSTVPRDWSVRMSPKWPILCRVERKTLTQSINQPASSHSELKV